MLDLAIIVVYLLVVLTVGILNGLKIKTMRDFSVSNQKFATPVLVATISATFIGGGSTVGVAEKVFSVGIIFLFVCFGNSVHKLLLAQFIAPRMSRFIKALSVGDIMFDLYGKPGRLAVGISGTLISISAVGAQITAMGYLLHYLIGISHFWGIILGCGVVVIYSSFGGIKSVVMTDVIQFYVVAVAIPMVCGVGLSKVGGYSALFAALPDTHTQVFADKSRLIECISLFVIFSLPWLEPAFAQRLLLSKDLKKTARSFKVAAMLDIPFFMITVTLGLIAVVLNPELKASLALPYLINTILPVGLKGLAIIGMMAVIMSTADSFLNASAITLVRDFIKPLSKNPLSDKSELEVTRFASLGLGCGAIFAALSANSILEIVVIGDNFWGPIIFVPLLAGIFGFKSNTRAFYISVACALGAMAVWTVAFSQSLGVGSLVAGICGSAIGFFSAYFYENPPNKTISNFTKRFQMPDPAKAFGVFKTRLPIVSLRWLRTASAKRVEVFGAQYFGFGVFGVLNYVIPYFMWSASDSTTLTLTTLMRVFASILCFPLIMHETFSIRLQRYLPLYWHFTLMYCLPFFTTVMLLEHGISFRWLLNMVLAIFALSVLVDWLSFMVLFSIGASAAAVFFYSMEIFTIFLSNQKQCFGLFTCISLLLLSGYFLAGKRKNWLKSDLMPLEC